MIRATKETGWAIKVIVEKDQLVKSLNIYVSELRKLLEKNPSSVANNLIRREIRKNNKKVNIGKKNPAALSRGRRKSTGNIVGGRLGIENALKNHIIPDLIRHVDAVESAIKDINVDGRNAYGEIFKSNVEKIHSNVYRRLRLTFKNPGAIEHAVSDNRFVGIKYDRNNNRFFAGIGNISVLDEWTSIYVNKDGSIYEPPQDYGKIHAFWRFWEYTGVGRKTVFKSPQSFWFVLNRGYFNREDIAPRPFLMNNGGESFFSEDETIVRGIGKQMTEEFLDRINRTKSRLNPLTNRFFGK